ncbi:MAG: cell division protein PerM, partial [Streptosporangiaceae bacterium]
PMLPMLAALPSGAHSSATGWVSLLMLAVPYLAGAFGGLLTARAAPIPAVELAPLWGFACGVVTGCALGLLAAFAGGPLGSGRLTAVGPSGWQAGVVCVLEVGVAAAVTAGLVNWVRMRRLAPAAADLPVASPAAVTGDEAGAGPGGSHHIYLDPWGDAEDAADGRPDPPGPASLP